MRYSRESKLHERARVIKRVKYFLAKSFARERLFQQFIPERVVVTFRHFLTARTLRRAEEHKHFERLDDVVKFVGLIGGNEQTQPRHDINGLPATGEFRTPLYDVVHLVFGVRALLIDLAGAQSIDADAQVWRPEEFVVRRIAFGWYEHKSGSSGGSASLVKSRAAPSPRRRSAPLFEPRTASATLAACSSAIPSRHDARSFSRDLK
jgi:hypothetical protein